MANDNRELLEMAIASHEMRPLFLSKMGRIESPEASGSPFSVARLVHADQAARTGELALASPGRKRSPRQERPFEYVLDLLVPNAWKPPAVSCNEPFLAFTNSQAAAAQPL